MLTLRMSATVCRSQTPGRDRWRARRSPPAAPRGAWRSTELSRQQLRSLSAPPSCNEHPHACRYAVLVKSPHAYWERARSTCGRTVTPLERMNMRLLSGRCLHERFLADGQ